MSFARLLILAIINYSKSFYSYVSYNRNTDMITVMKDVEDWPGGDCSLNSSFSVSSLDVLILPLPCGFPGEAPQTDLHMHL